MKYLIKDKKLPLKHVPGKGAWTYHLQIPGTKDIRGKWGDMKVSGSIDGYKIENRNLAPIKGADKMISINHTIRKAIKKTGGDMVNVTLYLSDKPEQIDQQKILDSLDEGGVLDKFQSLSRDVQNSIIDGILSAQTEEKQIGLIVKYIDKLS